MVPISSEGERGRVERERGGKGREKGRKGKERKRRRELWLFSLLDPNLSLNYWLFVQLSIWYEGAKLTSTLGGTHKFPPHPKIIREGKFSSWLMLQEMWRVMYPELLDEGNGRATGSCFNAVRIYLNFGWKFVWVLPDTYKDQCLFCGQHDRYNGEKRVHVLQCGR